MKAFNLTNKVESAMPVTLSEDEIDDLLYFARAGETEDFNVLKEELLKRENVPLAGLLEAARDETSENGVLHMAGANGHQELLKVLCAELSKPSPQNETMLAIINSQNKAGNTPLHWAALNGHLEAVKLLLENGGDPTITNARGHDAVYEAELNDKQEVVEWVLKEGGDGLEEVVSGAQEEDDDAEEEDSADAEAVPETDGEGSKLGQELKNLDITEDKTSG